MVDLYDKPFYLNDEQVKWVHRTLSEMPLRDKIGQLFCELVNSEQEDDMDRIFRIVKPGGIMFRPISIEQAHSLVSYLQQRSDIPMLIAGNLESGGNGACIEGTYYGEPMAAAATDDEEYAYKLARVACGEGAALGFNYTFEPLVDIDINPFNLTTNTRTFGSEPERIRRMAKAYINGAQDSGLAACIKHWPGEGKDFRDQHLLSTVNTCSIEEWNLTYRKNYQELIDAGVQTLMAAHIRLPEYSRKLSPGIKDEDILPASLSYDITTTLLRNEMGFNGMVISDATQMVGFTTFIPRKEAVPACIMAGVDMFLFTINHEEDVQAMMDAIDNGKLTIDRLNEAVIRILALKASLKLPEKKENGTLVPPLEKAKEIIGCNEHVEWSKECADKSITLVKNKNNLIPISVTKTKRILFRILNNQPGRANHYDDESKLFKKLMEDKGFIITDFADEYVPSRNVSYNTIDDFKKNFDLIIYISTGRLRKRIEWVESMQFDVPKFTADIPYIFISFNSPHHIMDVPMVQGYINAYSSNNAAVKAVVEKLTGESEFKGISPVDEFCGLWDTKL